MGNVIRQGNQWHAHPHDVVVAFDTRRALEWLCASALWAALCVPASAQNIPPIGKGTDIATMCGKKPMTLALSDGVGGNTWRKIALAELKQELGKCSNVRKIIYSNANGDRQKANGDINSLVARGVDVLIVFPDFGAAQLPAIRSAFQAGVTVVPYLVDLGGKAGVDYSALVRNDLDASGVQFADWMGKTVPSGNIIFLGGIAGGPSSQSFMDGITKGIRKYPGVKLLDDHFIVTNWNPADAQKAVAGLLAKYPKIDGIIADNGAVTLAAIKAFEQAGLPVPPQATISSNNELNCKYLSDKAAGKGFKYFSLDGDTALVRYAARRGVAMFQGTANPDPLIVNPFVFIDTAAGIEPKCDPSAPPDADFSGQLDAATLSALFKR